MDATPDHDDRESPSGEWQPAITLREQSRRARYARIREAAEQLVEEKGFDATTTREVAKRAGVGEATLFRYVSSKDELLLMVVGERADQLADAIELADERAIAGARGAARLPGGWFLDRILAIYAARVAFYRADPDTVAKYLSYGLRTESAMGRRSISHGDRIIARVTRILESAQDLGVISSAVPASIVAQNCNGTWIHEVLRQPVRSLDVEGTWPRLRQRLLVQLDPLVLDGSNATAP